MLSNQRKIIEQAKFRFSPLGKAFKKQRKTIEEQRKKQINSVMNQIQRLAALTNKGIYKEIFDKRVD